MTIFLNKVVAKLGQGTHISKTHWLLLIDL